MRKLLCVQPKGNSYPCKVGSTDSKTIWSESRKRSNRNRRNVWKSCKNGSRLIRNLKQPTLNRDKPNKRWRCWWLNSLQKTTNLSIKGIQGISLTCQDPSLIRLHSTPFSLCSNPFFRCKAWSATVFRNSSGQLVQLRRMSRNSSKLWHRQCGHWKQGSRPLNLVPRRTASRAKWWARMKSSPMEICIPGFSKITPKDKKPSRGACRTPSQKRDDWRRNASKKGKVCSLLRLSIWIQLIAVPFFLSLSRIGEADNPGPAHATAKLFGEQIEAIGQWATNFTSKSDMELTPLLAQVGKCRQMFSDRVLYRSVRTSKGTHSHMDSFLLPVSSDSARTQQFSNCLSFFKSVTNAMKVGMFRLRGNFVTGVARSTTTPSVIMRREEDASTLARNANSKLLRVW